MPRRLGPSKSKADLDQTRHVEQSRGHELISTRAVGRGDLRVQEEPVRVLTNAVLMNENHEGREQEERARWIARQNSGTSRSQGEKARSERKLATFAPGCKVFLLREGRKVGTARLMIPSPEGDNLFQRKLHNHELSMYEVEDQFLVVIMSPDIAEDCKLLTYTYKYGGVEAPPLRLGDMKNGFYAWNLRDLVPISETLPEEGQEERIKMDTAEAERAQPTAGLINNVRGRDEEDELFSGQDSDLNEDYEPIPSELGKLKDSSSGRKRKYTYRQRTRRLDNGECSLSKRRKAAVSAANEKDLRLLLCCSRKKCFKNADHRFLCAQMKRILCMSQPERRQVLRDMFDSRMDAFVFNGSAVCASFLQRAFGFSRDLQSSVKGTSASKPLPETPALPKSKTSDKRDAMISFLERLAESCGDNMPDRNEQHLPFFTKDNVYDVFGEEYLKLYPGEMLPSQPYFYETWRMYCPQIKVRKVHRFAKCGICERLRGLQESARSNPKRLKELKKQKLQHNALIAAERREYQKKVDKSKLHPDEYCSFIIDGADQSAFGLPHFPIRSKDARGHTMAVKMVGVLEHGPLKHLSLFLMTEQYETGANHIVEALHRVLTFRIMTAPLPKTMFVQLDNSSRENKNKYVFAYLESLVAKGVTCEVYASFLPVGHTHADIDQTFSCTSRRLRSAAAVTMDDMIRELSMSYTPTPRVSHMKRIVNFSGLCQLERCLKPFYGFTQYHYFHFLRSSESAFLETGSYYPTTCLVREYSQNQWKPLFGNRGGGFLTCVPDFRRTPPTSVVSPTNLREVNKRLDSEEVRINSTKKMASLRALRDDVYRTDSEPFHWDLRTCFEENGAYKKGLTNYESTEEASTSADRDPLIEVGYNVNEFVAVRIRDKTPTVPFWIAKVLEVEKNNRGVPYQLKIHWYELNGGRNAFDGTYTPSTLKVEGIERPWVVTVSVDAVLNTFQGLTTGRRLRTCEKKSIRDALKITEN